MGTNVSCGWPTVTNFLSEDQIVNDIISKLPQEDKEYLVNMPENDLIIFHHSWGRMIRNEYWLWHPDNPFTDSSDPNGDHHADQMSNRIITRVYFTLKN